MSSSAQQQQHFHESEGSVHVQQWQFEDNIHPIESIDTPPFALIKMKVERGEKSVTLASSLPRTDVTTRKKSSTFTPARS
ncbi:unnamed protein product [Cylicocyclus nassatus]|uniref:Uncharacterized protein n=1 Tax=Cylicocyclus nassatus TaxID=53992 RepID=A0AA36M3S8_CYLNA|nr:unnamed protein product [Cylicocyclus nassatus]